MFHINPDILVHRDIPHLITAIANTTSHINIKLTVLMLLILTHYNLDLLCIAHVPPYEGQSSHPIFTMTKKSYIQITQYHYLHMEPASPY